MKEYYKKFAPVWEGYEPGAFLGSGSYGDVWELKKIGHSGPATEAFKEVKVPPETIGGMEEALLQGLDIEGARFFYQGMKQKALDEVKLMERLSDCPEIVQFRDYKVRELSGLNGEYGWVIFIRMELLKPFKDKLKQEGITVAEIIRLGIDLCNALIVCGWEGILHRDIKPENLFYSEYTGKYKLGDFGISCFLSRVTEEKGLPGTLTHMSPEIYQGKTFTPAGDLYAVGMILYKLLNDNRVPFLPPYPEPYSPVMRNQALRRRLLGGQIQPASIVSGTEETKHPTLKVTAEELPTAQRLEAVARRAIDPDPQRRYLSAGALKGALQALL